LDHRVGGRLGQAIAGELAGRAAVLRQFTRAPAGSAVPIILIERRLSAYIFSMSMMARIPHVASDTESPDDGTQTSKESAAASYRVAA
jgi:hypothetical protein